MPPDIQTQTAVPPVPISPAIEQHMMRVRDLVRLLLQNGHELQEWEERHGQKAIIVPAPTAVKTPTIATTPPPATPPKISPVLSDQREVLDEELQKRFDLELTSTTLIDRVNAGITDPAIRRQNAQAILLRLGIDVPNSPRFISIAKKMHIRPPVKLARTFKDIHGALTVITSDGRMFASAAAPSTFVLLKHWGYARGDFDITEPTYPAWVLDQLPIERQRREWESGFEAEEIETGASRIHLSPFEKVRREQRKLPHRV